MTAARSIVLFQAALGYFRYSTDRERMGASPQQGYATWLPSREPNWGSVPEGAGNGRFVIFSNGVQTGHITRMKITPRPEMYGFISRQTSVWLK